MSRQTHLSTLIRETLADLDHQIATIGELVGKADRAQHLIAQLAARREAIVGRVARSKKRPSVLFEYCVCIKYDPDPARRFANPGRFIMVGGHLGPGFDSVEWRRASLYPARRWGRLDGV